MSLMNKFESGDVKRKKSHVKNLIKVASADGHVDDVEKEFLSKIAKKFNVDQEEVDHIIAHPDQYSFSPPSSATERHEQMLNLVIMMMIDNVIDDGEMKMIRTFAIGLGYPIQKVDAIVKRAMEAVEKNLEEEDAIGFLSEA